MPRKLIQEGEHARRLEWICEDLDRVIKQRVNSRLVVAQAMITAQLTEDAIWAECCDSNVVDLDSWRVSHDTALAQA